MSLRDHYKLSFIDRTRQGSEITVEDFLASEKEANAIREGLTVFAAEAGLTDFQVFKAPDASTLLRPIQAVTSLLKDIGDRDVTEQKAQELLEVARKIDRDISEQAAPPGFSIEFAWDTGGQSDNAYSQPFLGTDVVSLMTEFQEKLCDLMNEIAYDVHVAAFSPVGLKASPDVLLSNLEKIGHENDYAEFIEAIHKLHDRMKHEADLGTPAP